MNPLVKRQFELIQEQIAELRDLLKEQKEEKESALEKKQEEKDSLRKDLWSYRKEAITLGRISEDYDTVVAENEAFREERKTLREGLERVLNYAKALEGVFRP